MRHVYRYEVNIDDEPKSHRLTSDPLAAAMSGEYVAEFWAEFDSYRPIKERWFRIFATGQPLPDEARHVATLPRTPAGFIWHLYEMMYHGR